MPYHESTQIRNFIANSTQDPNLIFERRPVSKSCSVTGTHCASSYQRPASHSEAPANFDMAPRSTFSIHTKLVEDLSLERKSNRHFLTPPRPYPPSGPISLGAIIASPTQPDELIHRAPLLSPSDISTFTEQTWSGAHIKKSSSRFGVWTYFLEMVLSIGIDIEVETNKELRQIWNVERMTTLSSHPSERFLIDAVSHPDVRDYITSHMFREKIYIITGVMIAASSTSIRETLEERGLHIHAGVDATAWSGIPISARPDGKWTRRTETIWSSTRIEEFVFGYRVREVKVRRKGGVKAHRPYDKGALFDTERKRVVEQAEVEFEGLGEDTGGEEFDLDVRDVEQQGENDLEKVTSVVPEKS